MDAGLISRATILRVLLFSAVAAGCTPPSESARPSASVPLNALPWPTPETAPLDPSHFGWRTVVDEFDADGQTIRHWLYVGLLSDVEPAARIPLVETPWSFTTFAQQIPVTAGPAGGFVLYVADDGTSSQLRAVRIDGTEDRMIGAVDRVVLSAALAPDGSTAYVDLLDRTTGSEVGVFAAPTDGTGNLVRVMGPAVGKAAALPTGIVLAAVSRFERRLSASSDGQVARLACGTASCQLDVVNVRTGDFVSFQEPAILVFYGIADGIIVGMFDCRQPACPDFDRMEAVEVATGVRIQLPVDSGTTVATGGDGRLILVGQPGAAEGRTEPEIRGLDLRTGATTILATLDGALLPEPNDRFGVEMPRGWQWIAICDEGLCPLALNLSDGQRIPLLDVQAQTPIGGGHD